MDFIEFKELLQNIEKYVSRVKRGESLIVMRRSKPLFKISPIDNSEEWEEVIDFTKLRRGGVRIKDLLSRI